MMKTSVARVFGGTVFCFMAVMSSGCSNPFKPPPINIPVFTPPVTFPSPPSLSPGTNIPTPNPSDGRNYRTTEFGNNYGLARINAHSAYQRGYFGEGVVVGVIDSGVRTTHDDLDNNIVTGRDFVSPGTAVNDPEGHGTFVAGIIAAERNGRGMHGVAPAAKIMPLKISDSRGRLVGDWRAAFRYATARGVKIINNSFGDVGQVLIGRYQGQRYYAELPFFRGFLHDDDRRLARGIADDVGRDDAVFVWAAGNGGWHPGGRVQLRPSCNDLRAINCISDSTLPVTREQFLNGFVSENYTDYDGHFVAGEGSLLGMDGTTNEAGEIPDLSNYYSSLPIWAASNIDAILNDDDVSDEEIDRLLNDTRFRALFDRWLSVVATDRNNQIADFSNGCGLAFAWCLAAPGERIFSTTNTGDAGQGFSNGTSFAAPHVSGALAVLRSRLPRSTPMSIARLILLITATDLGAPGLDLTYGWGLVNLAAAMTVSGRLMMPNVSSAGNVLLSNARIDLPPGFSAVAKQLESVEVAVGGVGDAYWNMPLSDIVEVHSATINIGDAAADMLTPVRDHRVDAGLFFATTDAKTNQFRRVGAEFSAGALGAWRLQHSFCDDCERSAWREWSVFNPADKLALPFFADDDKSAFVLQMQGEGLRPFAAMSGDVHDKGESPYQQFGLRWQKNYSRFGVLAEASEIHEDKSFMGASFGALGQTEGRTKQGRVMLHGDLSADWRGFVGYERAHGEAEVTGLLSSVSGLRADGWSLGMEKRDTIGGGMLRFSARRETAIRSGRAVLRYTRAEGDFTGAFYSGVEGAPAYLQGAPQTLETRRSVVNLSTEPTTIYTLGYTVQPRPRMQLAVGAEYETSDRGKALSMQLQIAF